MDRALRVAEFFVRKEGFDALRTGIPDVVVIGFVRDGKTPYSLLFLRKPVGEEILKSRPFRWTFKQMIEEEGFAVFDADGKSPGDVFIILASAFDLEIV